jgi:hypothetical protein
MSARYRLHEVAASVILALALWLASGTLSPYGDQLGSIALEPCHYLVNIDHDQHLGGFYLLAGAEPSYWIGSVVLRRILYPIVAFPFIRLLGFLAGGLICNIVITIAAMLAFARFAGKRFGETAAVAVLWLLATYPGIPYWGGLPYSYAAIVPAALVATILLHRLDGEPPAREVVATALALGLLLLAYDLFAFFVPAAILLLLARRKVLHAVLLAIVSIAPMLLVNLTLEQIGVSAVNSNTAGYLTIIRAYLHPESMRGWIGNLAHLPVVLAANFLDSNFLFLPLLSLLAFALCRRCIGRVEGSILLSVLAVFLVNNAAPPYYGWQLRGVWIARLYQPVLPALILCIARAIAAKPRSLRVAVAFAVIANAAIAFGPVMMNPVAFYLDYRFYQFGRASVAPELLSLYGRRPLGFCRRSHEGDDRPPVPLSMFKPPNVFRTPPAP